MSKRAWGAAAFIVLVALMQAGIAAKLVFFREVEGTRFVRSNLLWDDGGGYVMAMITFNHPEVARQPWAKLILRDVPKKALVEKWGKWGIKFVPHIMPISPNRYPLFNLLANLYNRHFKDYRETFLWLMLTYPLWCLVKNLLLLLVFLKSGDGGPPPALYTVFFLDVIVPYSHIYYWFTTEAYAQLFLSFGMALWAFKGESFKARTWAYGLLLVSSLISLTSFFILLALLGVDVLRRFPLPGRETALAFCRRHFTALSFSLAAATLPAAAAYFLRDLALSPKQYNMWLEFFRTNLGYMAFFNLGLVVLLDWLSRRLDEEKAKGLLLPVLVMYLFALFIVVVSPFTDEQWRSGAGRLNAPIYAVLVMAVGSALSAGRIALAEGYGRLVKGLVAFSLLYMLPLYTSGDVLRVQKTDPFKPSDFPQAREEDGFKYFLAGNPQHIYNYFMDGSYQRGPLVLDIQTENYSPERAVHYLRSEALREKEANP